jgi:hypothetical protein
LVNIRLLVDRSSHFLSAELAQGGALHIRYTVGWPVFSACTELASFSAWAMASLREGKSTPAVPCADCSCARATPCRWTGHVEQVPASTSLTHQETRSTTSGIKSRRWLLRLPKIVACRGLAAKCDPGQPGEAAQDALEARGIVSRQGRRGMQRRTGRVSKEADLPNKI